MLNTNNMRIAFIESRNPLLAVERIHTLTIPFLASRMIGRSSLGKAKSTSIFDHQSGI
jgi:hypothetical protein